MHCSTCRHPIRPATFVEDTLFFHYIILAFHQESSFLMCVDLSLGLFLMPVLHGPYNNFSVVQLKIRDGDTSRSSFIVEDCFSYPAFSVFPYKVEYCSFNVCKEFLEY